MSIFNNIIKKIFYTKNDLEIIDESIKQFKNKGKKNNTNITGEGYEDIHSTSNFGNVGIGSFNLFYNNQINKSFKNNKAKLIEYRKMYQMPEIGDVVENAAMEATQEDMNGNIIKLEITDTTLNGNKNISDNINEAFKTLFIKRININNIITDLFISLLVDGKIFLENVINKSRPSLGILKLKKLPSETMDYNIDPNTGKITNFFQYLTENAKLPNSFEEAENSDKIIPFYPLQITYIDSGIYGINKKDVKSYLHKCIQPFNQLRLLETSVVIYRLIRSPERLVFRIDTGNMPKDKAMKYVDKIKQKFTNKQVYDPNTGSLSNSTDITSILENYFLSQNSDGRGSQIDSIGGNPSGFSELDDIHYFQKKLYRSLKYPMSRVDAMNENRDSDIVFGGNSGNIQRDEIMWGKYLQKYQQRITDKLLDLFLLHLKFIGYVRQYDITKLKLKIIMQPPNSFVENIEQSILQQRFENYQNLANNDEFPKSFLMKKYLKYTDEDFKELKQGFDDDKKYLKVTNESIIF